jgi:hypothetical protein
LDQLLRCHAKYLTTSEKQQVLDFAHAHLPDDKTKGLVKIVEQPPLKLEHIPGFPSFVVCVTAPYTTIAIVRMDCQH